MSLILRSPYPESVAYTPSLDFSDARNSQYYFALSFFGW